MQYLHRKTHQSLWGKVVDVIKKPQTQSLNEKVHFFPIHINGVSLSSLKRN